MRKVWYYDKNKNVLAKGEHAYFYKGVNGHKQSYKNLYIPHDLNTKECISGKFSIQKILRLDKKRSYFVDTYWLFK